MAMLLSEEDDDEYIDNNEEHKRSWRRTCLLERNSEGCYSQILSDLATYDTPEF